MYGMKALETEADTATDTLNIRVERDELGELRDKYVDELAVAIDEIETVLINESEATQAEVLRNMLEAIKLSERVLTETWNSFHGTEENVAVAPGK